MNGQQRIDAILEMSAAMCNVDELKPSTRQDLIERLKNEPPDAQEHVLAEMINWLQKRNKIQ